MRIHHALIATAAIALTVLTASMADAQYVAGTGWRYHNGPYPGYGYGPYAGYDRPYVGTYYSYGADRANPSLAPNGWDLGNPRDFQLQGSR